MIEVDPEKVSPERLAELIPKCREALAEMAILRRFKGVPSKQCSEETDLREWLTKAELLDDDPEKDRENLMRPKTDLFEDMEPVDVWFIDEKSGDLDNMGYFYVVAYDDVAIRLRERTNVPSLVTGQVFVRM